MFLITAIRRVFSVAFSLLGTGLFIARLQLWDLLLLLVSTLTPSLKQGAVIPAGRPGAGGHWPAYAAPGAGDSRSPCPGLNAMANHGIIPRDGRNVPFNALITAIRQTYNIDSPLATLLAYGAADLLQRDHKTGTMDLSDVNVHNVIEHDASFCRQDTYTWNQSTISQSTVHDLLAGATGTGGKQLVPADLSRALGALRVHSKATNPQYTDNLINKFVGSTNAALIQDVFGGIVADLRAFLLEERLPEGWEPRARARMGYGMTTMFAKIARIELGVEAEVDGSLGTQQLMRVDGAKEK